MTRPSVEVRRRLLKLVEKYPGLHLRELARLAETSEALAGYHLDGLVAAEVVFDTTEAGFRRFFAVRGKRVTQPDRDLMPLLRKEVPLAIVVALLEEGPLAHQRLVELVGMAKSTVSYHLALLERAGLVRQEAGGAYRLTQARRVERFVLRWEPSPDFLERFADVWARFYGSGPRK